MTEYPHGGIHDPEFHYTPGPFQPTLTTSYVVQTYSEPGWSTTITRATYIYDPSRVTRSTETTFYTEIFGPQLDRFHETHLPVLTTLVPVIPGPSKHSTMRNDGDFESITEPTPTTSPTDAVITPIAIPSATSHNGISTGAIVGAVIGAIAAALLILVVGLFFLIRRRRRQSAARLPATHQTRNSPPEQTRLQPATAVKEFSQLQDKSRSSSTTSFALQGMDPAYMKQAEAKQIV